MKTISATCLLCFLLAACGARHSVVLVADADGRVGQAEVITAVGRQSLTRAGDMTQLNGRSTPPSAVTTATPAYLAATFSEAQAIEPPGPEKFVLYFETGTTDLKPGSLDTIGRIVHASQRRQAISIVISGHTDSAGADQLNDKLSRDRAEFVQQLLQRRGAQFKRLSVSSHGKGNPAVPTADGVYEPRNRRVEVMVF